jgi:hypothetical protein
VEVRYEKLLWGKIKRFHLYVVKNTSQNRRQKDGVLIDRKGVLATTSFWRRPPLFWPIDLG